MTRSSGAPSSVARALRGRFLPFELFLRSLRERWWVGRLRALPRVAVDTSALGRMDAEVLAGMLRSGGTPHSAADERVVTSLALPEMTGGVNPGDQRALYALLVALRPRTVLEVGTHLGCSTVSLALAARRTGGRLETCDIADVNDSRSRPWTRFGSTASPRELVERAGCADLVTFRVGDSLERLRDAGPSFDLIFLDGDHAAATVYRELPLALRALRPGGFVLLHDYYPGNRPLWDDDPPLPGPFLAVQRLLAEGAAMNVLPFGELPWPTRSGSRVSSLALVSRAG